jgi:hypothetical protein
MMSHVGAQEVGIRFRAITTTGVGGHVEMAGARFDAAETPDRPMIGLVEMLGGSVNLAHPEDDSPKWFSAEESSTRSG